MNGRRVVDTPDTPLPELALLGQLPFTTIVSAAGGGVTRNGDVAINRWRADGTRDDYGQWHYVRDVRTGRIWSAAHQPVCAAADSYRVTMDLDRVSFFRRDGDIETRTDVVVVPDANAESRSVVVTNSSDHQREIELTSYQEVALASLAADRGHRAFGNLFVQTEWLPETTTLLAMRRPRSAMDIPSWCGHTIAISHDDGSHVSYETDRARFLGRGRTSRNPVAMGNAGDLTGNTGAVLDPVLALRKTLTIPANGSAQVVFTTFAARDRDDAVEQSRRFSSITEAGKPFDIGNTRESQLLDSLAINSWKAGTFQALTSRLLYEARTFHADDWGKPRGGGRDGLAALGVTAEWPILYSNLGQLPLEHVGHSLSMYLYWRAKGIATDLVMFCDDEASALEVRAHVSKIISTLKLEDLFDQPTGIRIIPVDSADMDTYRLLTSVAHNVGGASRHRVPARV